MQKRFKLGDEIEDVTSKTIGIAVGEAQYLDGSKAWLIQPYTTEDNEMLRPIWVNDAYCKYKGEGIYPSTKPPVGFHARDGVDGNGS